METTYNQTPWTSRRPCPTCASTDAWITTVGKQDVVSCVCGTYLYNAPRLETGREIRSLSSRPGLTVSQRSRILERCGHRCIACHHERPLEIAHLISRDDAARLGFLDEIIDSEYNLAAMCAECNSGQRVTGSIGLELLYRLMLIQHRNETPCER